MNVTNLGERRRQREKLAALSSAERATVAQTAADWRRMYASSILQIASERLAEILAWAMAAGLELGEDPRPPVILEATFGEKFSREALYARANELRALIPREAETLQRHLGMPVTQFARYRSAEDAARARADYEVSRIALRARNAGVISGEFCELLQQSVDRGQATEAGVLDMILGNVLARHRIGDGTF